MLRPTIASVTFLCAMAVAQNSTATLDACSQVDRRASTASVATSARLPEAPVPIAADPNDSHSKSNLDESLFKSYTTEHYEESNGRTLDRNFVLLHTFSTIALVADIETTVHSVAGRGSSEMNPLFGANPTRARLYGIVVPLNVLSFYVSYHYKKTEPERKLWAVSPLVSTAIHAGATINNLVVGRR